MKNSTEKTITDYFRKNDNVNELLYIKNSEVISAINSVKKIKDKEELSDTIKRICSDTSISLRKRLILFFVLKEDAYDFITIKDALSMDTSEDYRLLNIELEKLCNDYIVYHTKKDKYILYDKIPNIKRGKLQVKGNYGFLLLSKETGEDDIYISSDNFNYADRKSVV